MASSLAQAAQLGKLEVLSGAGEPFLAQIQVDLVLPEERASLQAKLASAEAFKAARLTLDPNLKNLQFAVQDGSQPGTALVKITSAQPLPAGFIDTLVELTWVGGRVAREYTLTIPVGQAKSEQPVTRLPEIRPPMAPPSEAKPVAPAAPAAPVAPPAAPAPTLAPEGTRQIVRGDTLSELAQELAGDGVTLNQAMAALYEANKDSFINGSVHLIREGAQIQVPNRAALRARSANEALLILAQNDDRNVYSAYARQIGLLTVENQSTAAASTSSQGSIAPQEKPVEGNAAQADRLQIAPGAAQGGGSVDSNAEELLAKSKALSEANERIALLEKNVSDLQRLLDMQNDVVADESAASVNAAEGDPDSLALEDSAAPVDVPSETLSEDAAQTPALNGEAGEGVEPPVVETPVQEDTPFDWMPWLLAGAGGLAVLLVLLLIARARRNKKQDDEDTEQDDELDFSEVKEFDEAVAAAGVGVAEEKAIGLNKSESSDFDLDEVLNERLKPVEPEDEVTQVVQADPELTDDIPELKEESEEAMQQTDSLNSDVKLSFPEDEPVVEKDNPIFDDLEMLEKGALSAQEELDQIRKQPLPGHQADEKEVSDAFDDLVDAELPETAVSEDQVSSKAGLAADAVPESDFDQAMVELDVDVPNPKVDDATWQEVATKLDLAGAYVEIGDADGAKELLNEIVNKGDVDQVRKAKALLASLN
ncbi:FimV/HubP family polar landmark protein [Limnobacter sp.]|uniref:FimV/HubP family polar landmark protein n=1 Tax=Limnobacter sp. TaxID=2003368 RepID=UPI002FE0539D